MAGEERIEPEAQEEVPTQAFSDRRRHSAAPRLAKIAGFGLLGLIVLIGVLLLGANTDPGRKLIVDQIENLEFENGMTIAIGRIDGSIYGEMVVRDLEIGDPKGRFLSSPAITVDWRPFKFMNGHLDIKSLTSDLITLERLPEFNETPPSDDPLLPDMDIDVDRLVIKRFVAEAPVSGERRAATMAGEVHIADGRAQVDFNGSTVAVDGGAGGDRIRLILDAVPEQNRMDVNLALDAPEGGIIAAMSGLEEPLNIRLSGNGDWASWKGALNADLGGSEFVRLGLSARDGTFGIKGSTRIARLFDGPTASLLGPVTNIDMLAALDERRADLKGQIYSDAFRLASDGLVDLGESRFEDLNLDFQLLKPSALAENLSGSGLRAILGLNGEFATPNVTYRLNAGLLAMNDMAIRQLRAEGAAEVNAERILIPVSARAAAINGLDTVAGGTLQDIRIDGDLAIDGPRILSDNLRVRSDRIDATAIIVADMSSGIYTGALNGRIDNYRVESVGIFDIRTQADLRQGPDGFVMAGRVSVRSRQITNESARNFLGGNAVAATNVAYGSDGTIRFTDLRLEAPLVRVIGGRGSYSPDGRIAIGADAVSQKYGAIGVRVAGTIADPNAVLTAERPGLGIGLANLTARVDGARNGYRLNATGDTDYGPLQADVTLLTSGGPLTLQINSAQFAGLDLDGTIRTTAAGPFVGRLNANGQGIGGVVRLDGQGQYQEALVNLRAKDAVLPGPANVAIGSAIVDARIILYDQPYIVADAEFAQTRFGSYDINAGRAVIDYRGGKGKAKVLAEGTAGAPFRIALNADMQPELWRAAVKGKARGIAFSTANPMRIIPQGGEYELLPTRIDIGGGNIRLAGNYGRGIKLQSRLEGIDISTANAFMPGLGLGGTASGSLDFVQASPGAFPRADARLTLKRFTRTTSAAVSQPVDVTFVGKLLPSGGEARAVIRKGGGVIGRLVASLSPLPPGSGSWTERLLSAPLDGGVRFNGPASTLISFGGLADQRMAGNIGVAADFSCRVSSPCLNGLVRAKNLTYENLTYGTRLTNMVVRAQFSGDRLQVDQLTATAGEGRLQAQGFVSLAADAGYPMDMSVTLDNARLARSDMISATASGNLRLAKRAGETALLSGEIRLPETRYQIIRQGSAEVPQLTGVRFKPPRGPQRITGDEPAKPQPGLFELVRLDIDLRAPERLYVSGMGLESEWSADFNISGTSAAPRLAGQVELIRGTLGFAGRSFDLQEGRVQFTGGQAIDPVIALRASDEIEDVTVNVNVSGRATDPEISFSSVPGLPQDEIVSRILFGSSAANLSTIQAVQLAASLNSLRGSGGGLNPLGKLRSATGVDRLRILGSDENAGRGTALAAGQYLTDDIYIEVITDARGFTATQLEISLTPALSVLSRAGGSGQSNASVQYRKNY